MMRYTIRQHGNRWCVVNNEDGSICGLSRGKLMRRRRFFNKSQALELAELCNYWERWS